MVEEQLVVSSDTSSGKEDPNCIETVAPHPDQPILLQPQTAPDARLGHSSDERATPKPPEPGAVPEPVEADINRTTSKPELDQPQTQSLRQNAEASASNRSKLIQKITLNNLNNAEEGQPGTIPNLLPNPSDEEVENEIIVPQAEPMPSFQPPEERDAKQTLHLSENNQSSSNTNKSTMVVEQAGLKESDGEEVCGPTSSNLPQPDARSSALRKEDSDEPGKSKKPPQRADPPSKLLRTKLRPREKDPGQISTIKEIERKAREEQVESRRAGAKTGHPTHSTFNFQDARPGRRKKLALSNEASLAARGAPGEANPKPLERKKKKSAGLGAAPDRDSAERREEPAAPEEDQSTGEHKPAPQSAQKPPSRKMTSPEDSQTDEQPDNIVRRLRRGAGGKAVKVSQDSSGGKDRDKLQRKKLRNQKVIEVKSRKGRPV